jgi:hypothetical protein
MYKRNMEKRSLNHCCSATTVRITYSERIPVALVILSSMQCTCAILSSVACLALQYFSTVSHKRHDFRKKKSLNTKCLFWFSLEILSGTFLILIFPQYLTNGTIFGKKVIEHKMSVLIFSRNSVWNISHSNFSTVSHKRHDFRKKSHWTQNVCFDFL